MVGRLDLVLNRVGKRTFRKVSCVAVFTRPIAEARAEAMRSSESTGRIAFCFDPAEQSGQGHIAQYFFPWRWEDQGVMQLVLLKRFNKRQRSLRERDSMCLIGLHASGRDIPNARVQVEFVPCGAAHFAAARRSQDQEQESSARTITDAVFGKMCCDEPRHLLPGHSRLVLPLCRLLGEQVVDNADGFRRDMAVSPCPLHDRMHALPSAGRSFSLGQPDRAKHISAIGWADRIELTVPQFGKGVSF